MKRQIYYSLLFLLIPVFFHGCEDSLTILPPDGKVKNEYWKSKEDVRATLMGAYKRLAMNDELLFYYGELRSDMLEEGVNLSNDLRDIMKSNIYPSNNWTKWGSFYSVINYCNLVLKYSPEVKIIDGNFSDYDFNRYNAEAIFLRSLCYFYLVRVFKDVPFILTPYDTDKQNFFPTKLSDDEILGFLVDHLTNILPMIPVEHETNDKTRGRATRGAVHALLADIALWRFDYQACIDHIEIIENSDLYKLVPGSNWFTIFSEGNTLEGIFELQFNSQLGQDNNMFDVTTSTNNYFLSSDYAFQILSPILSKEVIRGNGSITINKLIWKYIGQKPDGFSFRSGNDRRSCNWIVYRLADVLLMKAEALSQMGAYDEAIAIVNEIRARAFLEPYSSYPQNPTALEELIIEERARELAFEGKRWFDLLRMGRRNNFERKSKLIEIIIRNVPATQKRILAMKLNDPYGWYLPIYEKELENNINLVQNPYYQIY
jgi:starch-binding outer membrane protein, SusD/RagB family